MRKMLRLLSPIIFFAAGLQAQNTPPVKDSLPPYLKYPNMPAFNIMELDSTVFNTYNIPKGNPVALVYFDPHCKHCKNSTARLVKSMDSVKNVQFYFATPIHDSAAIRTFYKDYHLGDYKNIKIVGRDYEFFFMSYYGIRSLPDVAMYDSKKKLVKLIEGEFYASDIYKYVH